VATAGSPQLVSAVRKPFRCCVAQLSSSAVDTMSETTLTAGSAVAKGSRRMLASSLAAPAMRVGPARSRSRGSLVAQAEAADDYLAYRPGSEIS